MQSVFKLPLAIELLAHVDAGDLRLDDEVTIRPSDLRPGPGGALADELPNGGTRSMLALLERMVIASDNTAADILLERVGGPRKVTDRLHALGIEGVDVSRSEADLHFDFTGVTQRPPRDTWTLAKLHEVTNTPPAVRRSALATYLADPRDTAKPNAMVDLLLRVHQRKVLKPESGERLVSILERTTTGKKRLRGLLPPETVVAHKTGMSDTTDGVTAATNDVGIITLPGNAGHVVIAAFLSNSKGDDDTRDRAIATVTRAMVDHFTKR
ncbi:Beta-lactamase [Labilithrix luteola]|uniref:beta-lactamase n=2 Tax=Labilithrix luteola TaxID=1391654 RepID=A0A0K1PTJ4_9BACT|nr:Beta-lactamase [Labilithrix luteola]